MVLFLLARRDLYLLHRLIDSRFGRVIDAIRENETRAEAIGYPVYRYQLACFVIAGAVAGLAGALLANHGKYVNPNVLHWIAVGHADDHGDPRRRRPAVGRRDRRRGAARPGAPDRRAIRSPGSAALAPNYQQHANLGVGVVLLAIVLFAPAGHRRLLSRRNMLRLEGVAKRFGGVVATDGVDLEVARRARCTR